jgi:hypothetical protein
MKPVYTARVTMIEAFREFLYSGDDEDKPWINETNLIATISGVESYNVKAAFGTSGHSIIEDAPAYKTNTGYKVKDFVFSDTQVAPLLKFRSEHPLMSRELPLAKLYVTPWFDLIVTGTCDHLEGIMMRDTKFKFSQFDLTDFMDSAQYRFYLDMAGMKYFYYDFFKVSGFDSMADMAKARIGECESLPLQAYSGMEDDLQSLLADFSDWIQFKGLEQYLAITPVKAQKIISGNPSLRKLITI